MVFHKQICMLIYINKNNGEKINFLKTNLNNKNINVNIKHLRNTNRPLTEKPSTRKPGEKIPALHPASIVSPKQENLSKRNISNIRFTVPWLPFLNSCFKALTVFKSLNSHMSGPRYDILPCP